MPAAYPITLLVPPYQGQGVPVTLCEQRAAEGTTVLEGEVIAVMESQKASFDYKARASGRVLWLMQPGDTALPGSPLCRIAEAEPSEQAVLDEVGSETLSKFRA